MVGCSEQVCWKTCRVYGFVPGGRTLRNRTDSGNRFNMIDFPDFVWDQVPTKPVGFHIGPPEQRPSDNGPDEGYRFRIGPRDSQYRNNALGTMH